MRKKKINRTAESLKSRYHDYLHKISEKEMKKIVNFIENSGINGYISFEDGDFKVNEFEKVDKKR